MKGYTIKTNPKFALTMYKNMCQRILDFLLIVNGLSQPFPIHDIKNNTQELNKLFHEQTEIIKSIIFQMEKQTAHKKINKDCDVIYGAQDKRKGSWFEKTTGEVSWKIINSLSVCILE